MTHPLLRELALLVPQIRRLTESRDAALRERDEALAALAARRTAPTATSSTAEGDALIERTLTMVRAEYTVMPRFGFHQPLDYHVDSFPPQFDPPVRLESETLPLPAPADRFGYPADDAMYLAMGKLDADMVRGQIERFRGRPDGLAILDFGCSSGRVLRHFETERQDRSWQLYGVDVQARCIEWLRLHFPDDYVVSTGTVMPTLPFPDGSLDVIYGISVFTHIKYLWDMWLLELKRVLKPGGLLIQTIHTEAAWEFYHRNRAESWVRDNHSARMIATPKMTDPWFHYGDIAVSQAFWQVETARRNWGRYLEVLDILPPQHEHSFQDVMVCRKPG